MFRLTMHFRIPCVAAVATAWMFACAQADPIGNLPPNTNPGSGGGSSEGGGKSTNGGKTSATGGAKTTDTVVERGGSSATEGGSSGEPSLAGAAGATKAGTSGSGGKLGTAGASSTKTTSKGGTTGAGGTTVSAGGALGGASNSAGGATLNLAGAAGAGTGSCLENAKTACESKYCIVNNADEKLYCEAYLLCWVANACGPTDPCSNNGSNGLCSPNKIGGGMSPFDAATATVKACCP